MSASVVNSGKRSTVIAIVLSANRRKFPVQGNVRSLNESQAARASAAVDIAGEEDQSFGAADRVRMRLAAVVALRYTPKIGKPVGGIGFIPR